MLRTFIQVLALVLSLTSAYFLIKGVLQLSVSGMAQLSSTYCDYNLAMAQSCCHQRADYVIGFVLLVCGSIVQGVNLLWQYRIDDYGVSKSGAVLAVIVSVGIFIISNKLSNFLYNTCYRQVENILKKID